MANQDHVDRLLQGVEAWNSWREENPEVRPILRDANLQGINLNGVNLQGAILIGAKLYQASFYGANLQEAILSTAIACYADFRGSNLNKADLRWANLQRANFRGTDLRDSDLSMANLVEAQLYEANLSQAKLCSARLDKAVLPRADLSRANLTGAQLIGAELIQANLLGANCTEANFTNAGLTDIQALATNFERATLTGACIEDWHIYSKNNPANLNNVICEYIFLENQQQERCPHDRNQNFAPGEFTKRYQIVVETVELFFHDGIDWKAFLASLQDLKTKYGDDLNIQGIEKKAGGSFMVRLEVPSDIDKGAFERDGREFYETKLQIQEAQYYEKLQAKDREIEIYRQQSADILELAKLAASRPIHIEAKAVAENQFSSESYTNTFNNSPIANFANKMQDQASQQTNQYIGANLNEITTLICSLRSIAEAFPEAQRSEAIEHLTDLETDLQQSPEKRKCSRIKATLLALVGVATAISGAVTNTNEFVGQVQELSDKLGIPLAIKQVEPQQKAIAPEQP